MRLKRVCSLAAAAVGIFVAFGGAFGATTVPHTVRRGLVFDLGFVNPTTDATKDNIKDFVRWSSPSQLGFWKNVGMGTCSDAQAALYGTPESVSVRTGSFKNAIYPSRTETITYMHFPQTTYRDGKLNLVYPNGFITDQAVVTGSNMTFYLRFRWDGRTINTNQAIYTDNIVNNNNRLGGISCGIGVWSSQAYEEVESGYVRMGGALDTATDLGGAGLEVKTNVWYDLACTYKASFTKSGTAVVTNTLFSAYLAETGSRVIRAWSGNYTGKMVNNVTTKTWQDHLFVGGIHDGHTTGNNQLPTTYLTIGSFPVFRGDVASLQFYNRVLPLAEITTLFAGEDGSLFKAGIPNGSSYEFGADTDDLADVFQTDTMEVRRLRRDLTEAHPSLAFRYPARSDEEGIRKALEFLPYLDAAASNALLEVYANGNYLSTLRLRDRKACILTLPKSAVARDADGMATLRLVRTGNLAGTVTFDYITVGGTWQVGTRDGRYDDTCFLRMTTLRPAQTLQTHPSQIPGGNGGVECLFSELYGMREDKAYTYYPAESLVLEVPDAVAATYPSELTISLANDASTFRQFAVYVNGSKKFDQKGWGDYPQFVIPFEPGELNAGFNEVIVSNATCDFTKKSGSSSYFHVFLDQLSFKPLLKVDRGLRVYVTDDAIK